MTGIKSKLTSGTCASIKLKRASNQKLQTLKLFPVLVVAGGSASDVVTRIVPYWVDHIAPDLLSVGSGGVLVAAHGNSIRALRKHLEGITDDAIVDLEIPTGVPHRYRLADDLSIIGHEDVGDPDEIAAAADEVRRQAG